MDAGHIVFVFHALERDAKSSVIVVIRNKTRHRFPDDMGHDIVDLGMKDFLVGIQTNITIRVVKLAAERQLPNLGRIWVKVFDDDERFVHSLVFSLQSPV